MPGAKLRCQIGDLQIRGDPRQIGVGGKQGVEFIHLLFLRATIGLHQQFRHRDGGGDRPGIGLLKPGKDGIGEGEIPGIRLQLINEDTHIQCDPAVMSQKCAETF